MSSKPTHARAWFVIDKSGSIWMESGSVTRSAAMWTALEDRGMSNFAKDWEKLETQGWAVREFDLVMVKERR